MDSARDSYPQNYKDNVYDLIDCVGDHKVDWVAQTCACCLLFFTCNELKNEGNERGGYAENAEEAEEFANLFVRVEEKGSFFRKEIADEKEAETANKLRSVQDPVVETRVFKTEQVPQKYGRFVNDQKGEQQRLRLQVGSQLAGSFDSQVNYEYWNEETQDHKGRKQYEQVSAAINPVESLDARINTVNAIFCINEVVLRLRILLYVLGWAKREGQGGDG